jgi:hypothetical protein
MKPTTAGVAVALPIAYGGLQALGRSAGSSKAERAEPLPGDELVHHPMIVTDHAIAIEASPEEIWAWLVQMGWHRGGWYTARWVDRLLFPANGPSADRIVPGLQDLVAGDWIPDGPPDTKCGFIVTELERNRHLVLHSTAHLPPEFAARFDAWINWSWVFVLRELDDGRTRLLVRSRVRLGPRWLAAAYRALIVPADAVMARQMLRGLKKRAETTIDLDHLVHSPATASR